MKRILVTGAENSGTGLVTELLRKAGAEVVHRAVPHIDDWFPLFETKVREAGYDAIVFVARHHPAQTRSQQYRSGRASTALEAMKHVSSYAVQLEIPLHIWTYEAIVHEWPVSFGHAAHDLGISWDDIARVPRIEIRNENDKHYIAGEDEIVAYQDLENRLQDARKRLSEHRSE